MFSEQAHRAESDAGGGGIGALTVCRGGDRLLEEADWAEYDAGGGASGTLRFSGRSPGEEERTPGWY